MTSSDDIMAEIASLSASYADFEKLEGAQRPRFLQRAKQLALKVGVDPATVNELCEKYAWPVAAQRAPGSKTRMVMRAMNFERWQASDAKGRKSLDRQHARWARAVDFLHEQEGVPLDELAVEISRSGGILAVARRAAQSSPRKQPRREPEDDNKYLLPANAPISIPVAQVACVETLDDQGNEGGQAPSVETYPALMLSAAPEAAAEILAAPDGQILRLQVRHRRQDGGSILELASFVKVTATGGSLLYRRGRARVTVATTLRVRRGKRLGQT